ncbi:MAG: hypothetical protein HOO67_05565 [Candidatus Peribacteraceae bacterium]|nr:hypothetical protein [Candidatus Peribacteraceae bacterium]
MKIGTKSLLFGVHQFIVHPVVVGRAWRALYGRWPNLNEWIAIVVHDWGYWGLPNMDGPEGQLHPSRSAKVAFFVGKWAWKLKNLFRPAVRDTPGADIHYGLRCAMMVLLHSREMVRLTREQFGDLSVNPSTLCWPDKYSVCFESKWFYLLRARLSGEIHEFRANAVKSGKVSPESSAGDWLDWYRSYIYRLPDVARLRRQQDMQKFHAWLLRGNLR